MKKHGLWLFLACLVGLFSASSRTLFASVREDFDQAVSDFQQSPDDLGLRRQVINLSLELRTPPKRTAEQKVLLAKAIYLQKNADGQEDLLATISAYKKATFLAPWDGVLYYNQGVVEQEAGLPGDAIRDFKLYLLAKPNASDHDQVLDRLGKLDAMRDKQKATAETAEQDAATNARLAAINAEAKESWQDRKTTGVVLVIVGLCGVAASAWELGSGYGDTSSAGYTVYPGYSNGVLYNEYYNGKYWSAASWSQYNTGLSELSTGWILLGVGAAITVVGAVVLPGPFQPQTALLNYQDGRLALGVPPMNLALHGRGLNGTLFSANF